MVIASRLLINTQKCNIVESHQVNSQYVNQNVITQAVGTFAKKLQYISKIDQMVCELD